MAVDAIIALVADTAAADVGAAVLGDAVMGAVADVAVTDAVGAAVADAAFTGLGDAAIAGAADAAATGALEGAAAGLGADAAAGLGADAAASLGAESALSAEELAGLGADVTSGAVVPGADAAAAAADEAVASGGAAGGEVVGAVDPAAADAAAAASDEAVASGGAAPVTDANGNILVDAGGPGQAPVYDAVSTPGAGFGTPDPTLGAALGNYASAVADSLGTAGLLGAGALGGAALSGALTPSALSGNVGSGTANYEWGQGTPLVDPGLNPGYIAHAASMPYYQNASPTQSEYYWGVHAPVNTAADLAHYNDQAGAPATPWGLAHSAVGGQDQFNPAQFVNQYILNPQWQGVNNATGPGYTAPGPAVPVTQG